MVKSLAGCYKRLLSNLFIVIFILSLGHFIFNLFDVVKVQSIESSDIHALWKISSSDFLLSPSNKTISTQNDTNYLQDLLILYNTNIIDSNSKVISNVTVITSGNKIIEIIDKNSLNKYNFFKKLSQF